MRITPRRLNCLERIDEMKLWRKALRTIELLTDNPTSFVPFRFSDRDYEPVNIAIFLLSRNYFLDITTLFERCIVIFQLFIDFFIIHR